MVRLFLGIILINMHLDKNRKKKAPMYYSGALLD